MKVLEFLAHYSEQTPSQGDLEAIRQDSLSKFVPDSNKQNLSEEAIHEAEEAGLDPKVYKTILQKISNPVFVSNLTFRQLALDEYKKATKSPQEMIRDGEFSNLARNYFRLKDKITIAELMLVNPTFQREAEHIFDPSVGTSGSKASDLVDPTTETFTEKTTFLHLLFENNVTKDEIVDFLRKLGEVQDQEILTSYSSLSDRNGLSVAELLKQKKLK